ncbi:hydrolase [Kaistia algarum]|uniref:amidohydrolase family protein n=1 Tax=Kaistia algarum TaxID=2083279 RepID=UPI000CE7B501|nr:amidohydrolase family protein [Kaistia algarum]MCX5513954.1 amidohydrolase family protein [Kaistia algarum]PPE78072.1 hydrolase [Kaistia algarum]
MADNLYDGPIVDPHHHLWDRSLHRHAWLEGASDPALADQLPADYHAAVSGHNVVASVHVEANWDPANPYGEVEWLDGLDRSGGIAARYVAGANLADPKVEALLARYAAHPRVVGIRDILSWHPDPAKRFVDQRERMNDPSWQRGLACLAGHSLSFDLMITPWQMDSAARLVADFPETFFVLNHCGSPIDRDREGMAHWRRGLRELARAPNLALKISDPVAYDPDWTLESLRPVVLDCIDAFTPAQCLFASDYPVVALHASFGAIYDAFKTIVSGFSDSEQRAMFEANARAAYRLPDEF